MDDEERCPPSCFARDEQRQCAVFREQLHG
jgi:hypothetical protein